MSKRGRKKAPKSTPQVELARARNRMSYNKKKGNGPGEYYEIPKTEMERLREKWKAFEGTRLEESIIKPIFLTRK